jgi:hypothetical protein
MHVIGPAGHAEQRQRLVRGDHQLKPRPRRADELVAGQRVPEPARAERQPVRLRGHLAVQAEAGRAGAAPPQRRLAPRPVVVQGLAGVIVRPPQDRRLVIGDLVDAHRPEPRHDAALPSQPAGLKSRLRFGGISVEIRGNIG